MTEPHAPFDTIESAQEYVQLLALAIEEAIRDTAQNIDRASTAERHVDALRLVAYKLDQLRTHVAASGRTLNDLRSLRRLLLNERAHAAVPPQGA